MSRQSLARRLLRDSIAHAGWRYRVFVAAALGFGLVVLLPPQLLRYFTQTASQVPLMNGQAFARRLALLGTLTAFVLFIASVGRAWSNEWIRLRLETDLRRRLLMRIHEMPIELLDGAQRGEWLTRMTADLRQVEIFLAEALPGQIRSVAALVGSLVLFFCYSGGLGIVPLSTALLLGWVNLRAQRRLAPALDGVRSLQGGVSHLLLESMEGVRTIRTHAAEAFVQRRLEHRLTAITGDSLGVARSVGALLGGTELAGQVMITMCLTAVALALAGGRTTLEQALVYPFFLGVFHDAVQRLAGSAYGWNRFLIEGGRLAELLYGEPRLAVTTLVDHGFRRASSLEVRDLVLGHAGHALLGPVLFQVSRGEIRAVMGRSGCGKSTFLDVLAGLRSATGGDARVMDERGAPLWEVTCQQPLHLPLGPCAHVEQHPYVFEGTLRENLIFGNPKGVSDSAIEDILEGAGLDRFLRARGGLDQVLLDRGRNSSEGERYRIALCRALLLDRPFLLLDEPFAALDETSVISVVALLVARRATTGIVVVTHQIPKALPTDGVLDFDVLPRCRLAVSRHKLAGSCEAERRDSLFVPFSARISMDR